MCRCQNRMQLFLQLNLSELPQDLCGRFGGGLLQVFYCTTESEDCDLRWEPFSECQVTRIVKPKNREAQTSELPQGAPYFEPRKIVGWTRVDDLPSPNEHRLLDLIYEDDKSAQPPKGPDGWPRQRIICSELQVEIGGQDFWIAEEIGKCQARDKLGRLQRNFA